jgi:3-oxoacyl-[acyl-carrier protein] reductase
MVPSPEATSPSGDLTGRSAVVTGSSRGIGRAVAGALAAAGAAVVVNGRDRGAAEAAARELRSRGATATAVAGSPADPEVAESLVGMALDHTGGIDILVNCAGIAEPPGSSVLNVTTATWNELIDSHLNATFQTCRAAAPHMVAAGRGSIINTSSHAYLGIYGGTGYAAGKGGVTSLTMALAAELAEHRVRANVVCPGARTRLSSGEEFERHIDDLHARGLLDDLMREGSLNPGGAEYVAPLYAFLAGDLAMGVTGEVLVGAGGFVGRFPRPEVELLAWRDHDQQPPWTVGEIAALLDP